MREEYGKFFSTIWRETTLGRVDAQGRLLVNLQEIIPYNWRDDAKIFLALNLHNMVLLPFYSVNQNRGLHSTDRFSLQDEEMMWAMLVADVNAIEKRSNEIAARRERGYISATTVAMALGQLAPTLKTTSLQIWGPGENEMTAA